MPERSREHRAGGAAARRAPRADAQRNIEAILDAAFRCLSDNPQVSIGEIADAAGVGRVTLYGHFPNRATLVDAVFTRGLDHADRELDSVDTGGEPRAALARLVASSWQIIEQHQNLLVAAERELPAERIRAAHDAPMRRVLALIRRGRRGGQFRTDVPESWLVATFQSTLHAAAAEIHAGRMTDRNATRVITATLLASYTAPGTKVPSPPGAAA
jgi:AcrR family transcriptional regulator